MLNALIDETRRQAIRRAVAEGKPIPWIRKKDVILLEEPSVAVPPAAPRLERFFGQQGEEQLGYTGTYDTSEGGVLSGPISVGDLRQRALREEFLGVR